MILAVNNPEDLRNVAVKCKNNEEKDALLQFFEQYNVEWTSGGEAATKYNPDIEHQRIVFFNDKLYTTVIEQIHEHYKYIDFSEIKFSNIIRETDTSLLMNIYSYK